MQDITQEILIAIIPLLILELLLIVIALRDWLKKDNQNMENRYLWLLAIFLLNGIGPIVYFLAAPRNATELDFEDDSTWGN